MADTETTPALPEHYFRHEFGRLVSVLSRRFGVHRVELCEDAVQTALLRAVQSWPQRGLPDDRSAWLYRVALNEVLGALRRAKHTDTSADDIEELAAEAGTEEAVFLENEVKDDQLRMLFVSANPGIPRESQIVFALKILCGFSIEEIALRFFQGREAIYKRLQRARAALRECIAEPQSADVGQLASRMPAVLEILYLLFTEGYSSAQPDRLIRHELCEEAIRLGRLLEEHPVGSAAPEVAALLALMYLDTARFESRVDGTGGLLLLEQQDRSLWDRELIQIGVAYLHRAARGDNFTRYHAEAAIAAEHCLAPTYQETRWAEIARLYQMLDRVSPSPINTLNRAIAIAEWQGPEAGLALLEALKPPSWLLGYYLWDATLGELYRRRGDPERAMVHLTRALDAAPTDAEKALLRRRLEACSTCSDTTLDVQRQLHD
ncbi:MAG TPA: sigma-70 family RNA polymerase sigma factor [Steroidobacteraceae bacterium]|nr:sigma-70 family RNA polymerase sigma factor [Steroidobacteraceae bacterium]